MDSSEFNQIVISWITISIAFAILISEDFLNIFGYAQSLPIALVAVGTGFIFHELAHRNVAKLFGSHAEYRLWVPGLVFTLISAFLGFIFAAPGAVYISGKVSRQQNGMIAAAGPIANIIIAFLFMMAAFYLAPQGLLLTIILYSSYINFFLAFFNLLPFFILDGAKVFSWNPIVWAVLIFIAAFGSFFLF